MLWFYLSQWDGSLSLLQSVHDAPATKKHTWLCFSGGSVVVKPLVVYLKQKCVDCQGLHSVDVWKCNNCKLHWGCSVSHVHQKYQICREPIGFFLKYVPSQHMNELRVTLWNIGSENYRKKTFNSYNGCGSDYFDAGCLLHCLPGDLTPIKLSTIKPSHLEFTPCR